MASTMASGNRFGKAFAPWYLGQRAEHQESALLRNLHHQVRAMRRPANAKHGVAPVEESLGNRVKDLGEWPHRQSCASPPAPPAAAPATRRRLEGAPRGTAAPRTLPWLSRLRRASTGRRPCQSDMARQSESSTAVSCGSRPRVADQDARHACGRRRRQRSQQAGDFGHAVRAFKASRSVAEHREVLEVEPWPDRAPHQRVRPGRAGGLPVAGVNGVDRRLVAGQRSQLTLVSDARSADSCSSSSGAPS